MQTEERLENFDRKMEASGVRQMSAVEILKMVNAEFPLPGSGMSDTFKGTHSLTIVDNRLTIGIWCDDKCWLCWYEL